VRRMAKASAKLWCLLVLPVVMATAVAAQAARQASATASPTQTSTANSETEDLKNPNPKIRAKTARELGESGDPSVVPALAAALNDPSPKVRRQVVVALASIRVRSSLDALITATTDNDDEVRRLAVEGIEGYYTGQTPKSESGFMGFMGKQYRTVKRQFVESNLQVPPGTAVDIRATAALDRVMMDTRFHDASLAATRALGVLLAKPAVPDLVATAHSPNADMARAALDSLAKIKDISAGPKLLDLLDSPNRDLQQDAAVTIGILRTRAAVPKLQAMYENSPHKETREKALEGLGYIGDPVSGPLFLKALWDPDNSIEISAAEGIARSQYQPALPDLLRAAPAEKNAEVRLAMEFAITSLGRDDYLSSLVNDLGSGSRGGIAQAYLIELARNPALLPKLYSYMDSRDADVRRRLCNVLMYSGDKTSLAPLERASHDGNGDVAAAALRAMAAVRARTSAPPPASR
jgi:HEAT repeat protein